MTELERAVPTLVHASCFHSICVFSNIHSCSISKIHNDNFTLATDDIIFDKVSMYSWPSSLILTTLADNGLITCAKRSYKLATIQYNKLYIFWKHFV